MGLPIVVGGRSSCSRDVLTKTFRASTPADSSLSVSGRRKTINDDVAVTSAANNDKSLSATLTIKYLFNPDTGTTNGEYVYPYSKENLNPPSSHDIDVENVDGDNGGKSKGQSEAVAKPILIVAWLNLNITEMSDPLSPRSRSSTFLLPLLKVGAKKKRRSPTTGGNGRDTNAAASVADHAAHRIHSPVCEEHVPDAAVSSSPLMDLGETENHQRAAGDQNDGDTLPSVQPAVLFSSDGRHVACLVPHLFCPGCRHIEDTSVVICSLDKVENDDPERRLPLPSFMDSFPQVSPLSSNHRTIACTFATKPRVLGGTLHQQGGDTSRIFSTGSTISTITALCDAGRGAMLAGCRDGSILAIAWRGGLVAGVLYRHKGGEGEGDGDGDGDCRSIRGQGRGFRCLAHVGLRCSSRPDGGISGGQIGSGRVAAVRMDGSICIYKSTFYSPSQSVRSSGPIIDTTVTPHGRKMSMQPPQDAMPKASSSMKLARGSSSTRSLDCEDDSTSVRSVGSSRGSRASSFPRISGSGTLFDPVDRRSSLRWRSSNGSMDSATAMPVGNDDENDEDTNSSHQNSAAAQPSYKQPPGGGLSVKIDPLAVIPAELASGGKVSYVVWCNADVLAATVVGRQSGLSSTSSSSSFRPQHLEHLICQVWTVQRDGTVNLASNLAMRPQMIEEEANGYFGGSDKRNKCGVDEYDEDGHSHPVSALLQFDPSTGCLAVSNSIRSGEGSGAWRPFVCLWDWRSSVLGLVLCAGKKEDGVVNHGNVLFSALFFGHAGRSLFHIHATKTKIRRDSYEVATISPSETRHGCCVGGGFGFDNSGSFAGGRNRFSSHSVSASSYTKAASPLMLSETHVSFPFSSPATLSLQAVSSPDSTIDWREAKIPPSYTSSNGRPILASVGRKYGRSIAVACSRGVAVLDTARLIPKRSQRWLSRDACSPKVGTSERRGRGRLCDVPRRSCRRRHPLPCLGAAIEGSDVFSGETASVGDTIPSEHHRVKLGMNIALPKWRLFGNPSEEMCFRVHAMVWWERNAKRVGNVTGRTASVVSDDLLVAVVEFSPSVLSEDKGTYIGGGALHSCGDIGQMRLVCWSRRRLGMGKDQLLEDFALDGNSDSQWGIVLPPGLDPHSISILQIPTGEEDGEADDCDDEESDRNDPETDVDRALIAICSTGDFCAFAIYQLQTLPLYRGEIRGSDKGRGEEWDGGKYSCRILARLASSGRLRCVNFSCNGVFVAGGSFLFDLEDNGCVETDVHGYVATLAIIHNTGLEAVVMTGVGPSCSGPVLTVSGATGTLEDESLPRFARTEQCSTSTFWITDKEVTHRDADLGEMRGRFTWALRLTDGSVVIWSVPFEGPLQGRRRKQMKFQNHNGYGMGLHSHVYSPSLVRSTEVAEEGGKGPTPVKPRNGNLNELEREVPSSSGLVGELQARTFSALGDISPVIRSSPICMDNGTSAANASYDRIPLGPLPGSSLGSVLFVGQRSRVIRNQHAGAGALGGGGERPINAFSVANSIMAPPAFATSLLMSFLRAAASSNVHSCSPGLAASGSAGRTDDTPCGDWFSRRHIRSNFDALVKNQSARLMRRPLDDAVITALRVLCLHAIDLVYAGSREDKRDSSRDVDKDGDEDFEEKKELPTLADSKVESLLLRSIVSAANQVLSPLQFSVLFLGIARQLEPHHFNVLFPLRFAADVDTVAAAVEWKSSGDEADREDAVGGIVLGGDNDLHRAAAAVTASAWEDGILTVEDLFRLSSDCSIAVAASSLPLFSSKDVAHQVCTDMLRFCLDAISVDVGGNVVQSDGFVFNRDRDGAILGRLLSTVEMMRNAEEKSLVRQLYQYGLKLEEALLLQNAGSTDDATSPSHIGDIATVAGGDNRVRDDFVVAEGGGDGNTDLSVEDNMCDGEDGASERSSSASIGAYGTSDEELLSLSAAPKKTVLARMSSGLVSILRATRGEEDKKLKEELDKAISEAAHSFIASGFEEFNTPLVAEESSEDEGVARNNIAGQDRLESFSPEEECEEEHDVKELSPGEDYLSIKGVIATYMIDSVLSHSRSRVRGWKQAAAAAFLLSGVNERERQSFDETMVEKAIRDALGNDLVCNVLKFEASAETAVEVDEDSRQNERKICLTSYLEECIQQIDERACSFILDLGLALFMTREGYNFTVKRHRTELAIVLFIVAFVIAGGNPTAMVPLLPDNESKRSWFARAMEQAQSGIL